MTVRELMQVLQKYDDDWVVTYVDTSGESIDVNIEKPTKFTALSCYWYARLREHLYDSDAYVMAMDWAQQDSIAKFGAKLVNEWS